MNRLPIAFALSAVVLLSGCAAKPGSQSTPASPVQSSGGGTPSITISNWQFNAASTVPGNPPLTFAGSITAANPPAVTGALHVGGSNCFNQLTTLVFAGAASGGNVALTSMAVNGQVVTLGGNFTNVGFSGTYSVAGGCDGGDQGTVTGVTVDATDADAWDGGFTSSAQTTFSVEGSFAQSPSANSDGSFGISGTATFDTPCFSAATINPGSLPSGNFILGTLVSLQIQTNNGTISFLGTMDPSSGGISGTYTVVGGTCAQTGTAVLALTGQWDYH